MIYVNNLSKDITQAGLDVEVILKNGASNGEIYAYTLTNVNSSTPSIKFQKLVSNIVVSIASQKNNGNSSTTFAFGVDKASNVSNAAQNVRLYTNDATN
jgi:hypothetical protein